MRRERVAVGDRPSRHAATRAALGSIRVGSSAVFVASSGPDSSSTAADRLRGVKPVEFDPARPRLRRPGWPPGGPASSRRRSGWRRRPGRRRRPADRGVHDPGLVVPRDHLRHVDRRLQPDPGRVEEQQPLVPAVVVLPVRLQGVGGADDRHPVAHPHQPVDRLAVRQARRMAWFVGVLLQHAEPVVGAGAQPRQGGVERRQGGDRATARPRVVVPDVDVEPDLPPVGPGEVEDLLVGREALDPRRPLDAVTGR